MLEPDIVDTERCIPLVVGDTSSRLAEVGVEGEWRIWPKSEMVGVVGEILVRKETEEGDIEVVATVSDMEDGLRVSTFDFGFRSRVDSYSW